VRKKELEETARRLILIGSVAEKRKKKKKRGKRDGDSAGGKIDPLV